MYTLGDIVRSAATFFPEKTALVFEGMNLSYKEFNQRVNRLANAFVQLGCKKKERITILSENTHKYVEVYYAAAKVGLCVIPLNFRLSDTEITEIVKDSESILFIAGDGFEKRASAIRENLTTIKTWMSLDNKKTGFLYYEDILGASSTMEPSIHVGADELVMLIYTGGTTGIPKGVMLSHRNLITSAWSINLSYNFTRRDSACQVLPLFHIALWTVISLFIVGGTVVILRRPEVEDILRLIQEEKCTHVNLVPTLLGWILSYPNLDSFDLSSLTLLAYGGSSIAPEVLRKALLKFPNTAFAQGYGLTEAAPFVSWLKQEDHDLILSGQKSELLNSIGKGAPFVEMKLVDEGDAPVRPGEVGEIIVRGENVMLGYWNRPEMTEETMRNGWLHTGDMATVDEEGYVFLKDRKADMIVTGGENVYPKEVEDILYEHPAVQECAVVSAPDEKWGERIEAVIVLKTGMTANEEELISFCKGRLAGYKCPKGIEFWKELPKTSVGKIQRKEVKSRFWEKMDRLIG